MASAKKKPAAKKSAAISNKTTERTPYTPRVQVMVYIFVVLAILFASLAFYRYP